MSVQDDLTQVVTDLSTAQAAVETVVADLNAQVSGAPTVGDALLQAVTTVLTDAGYTVTPPAEPAPAA